MAKQTVRMNLNISVEADKQLEEILDLLKPANPKVTKTAIVEQGIAKIYAEVIKNA